VYLPIAFWVQHLQPRLAEAAMRLSTDLHRQGQVCQHAIGRKHRQHQMQRLRGAVSIWVDRPAKAIIDVM